MSRSRTLLVSLLLVTTALVGCLGDDASTGDDGAGASDLFHPSWHERALASGSGHDHTDPAQHANMTTPNFQIVGHDPLVTEYDGTSPGGSSCADATATSDDRRLGAQKAADSRGVVLVDLTDPEQPTKLGELFLTATHIYDVAVVPDGQHIALVTAHAKESRPPTDVLDIDQPVIGTWDDACTGKRVPLTTGQAVQAVQDPLPRPTSLLLVDISDPAQPTIVDQRPITGLGHGVFSTEIDGERWVLAITENIAQGSKHFHLYRLTDSPAGTVLEPLSVYASPPEPDHASGLVGHSDGWIAPHPATDQILGYYAAGSVLDIVDLSNPQTPEQIGRWTDMRGDRPIDHNIHSVHAMDELWDGTHYTVVGPELGGPPENGAPTGTVWVLDTTDPADPQEVAAWTLPSEVSWDGSLQFSTHYLTVHEATLFVSTYHGGIWAVDLSPVPTGTPEDPVLLDSLGVFTPTAPEAPAPQGYGFPWTPNLEEVHLLDPADGTLVTFDSNSGVYTFTFDASMPVPSPAPWPLEPLPPAGGGPSR